VNLGELTVTVLSLHDKIQFSFKEEMEQLEKACRCVPHSVRDVYILSAAV
jgi:hypothetical protein